MKSRRWVVGWLGGLLMVMACSRSEGLFKAVQMETPSVTVLLHTGDTLRFPQDMQGRWVVVGWIFTHCPDVCPVIASRFMMLEDSLVTRGYTPAKVRLLLLSFDPERDTLKQLQIYAKQFRAGSLLAIGRLNPIDLVSLSQSWGFFFKRIDHTDSQDSVSSSHKDHHGYGFAHDVKTYLVDPKGNVVGLYQGSMVEPLPVDSKELPNLWRIRTMQSVVAFLGFLTVVAVGVWGIHYFKRARAKVMEGKTLPSTLARQIPHRVFLFLYAPTCSVCKAQRPVVQALREHIPVVEVDLSRRAGLARQLGVFATPTYLYVERGKILRAWVGAQNIRSLLRELRVEPKPG